MSAAIVIAARANQRRADVFDEDDSADSTAAGDEEVMQEPFQTGTRRFLNLA
ncbi:hypothetical protein ACIQWB_38320 [Streptomyces olivaceus]|uniref:hypothetical protein n=1 Tax=Streptomyces olivaceus TaxID=47716 RepID=UPI00380D4B03